MPKHTDPDLSASAEEAARKVKDSAQQIWLAGLGAFAKAQVQGGKVFEALVEEGMDLQRKTQQAAQAQMAEVSDKWNSLAGGLSSRAGQQWDRLEGIFEDRVARALQRLDVASQTQVQQLQVRIQELETRLDALSPPPAAPPPRSPASRQRTAGSAAAAAKRGKGRT